MKKSLEIRQKMAAKLDDWKSKLQTRDAETDVEKRKLLSAEIEKLVSEHEAMAVELRQLESFEKAETEAAGQEQEKRTGGRAPETPEQKAAASFSLLRAARMATGKAPFEGLEKEMYDEANKEARATGISLSGDIRIPGFLMQGQKRDMTAGTASEGGNTIPTNLGEMIPILLPRLVTQRLGATMLTGLTGNLDIPRQNARTSAVWEGEVSAADETNITFDKLSLTPKRLAAFVDVTKQLMAQSSISAENLVRNDLNTAIRIAVDTAAINGATGGNNPVGILNTSGIGNVAIGTNGGAPTWAHMISLWKEIAADDADIAALNYLTTPGIAAQLMQTEKASSTAQYVWTSNNNVGAVNGYGAVTSTLVPSILTKGTSTDCHAILFGNWSELMIGQWAGLDITVDMYTRAKEAIVVFVVNSWWDIALRHPQSFAAIKDARVTI